MITRHQDLDVYKKALGLYFALDEVLSMIVAMIVSADRWVMPSGQKARRG